MAHSCQTVSVYVLFGLVWDDDGCTCIKDVKTAPCVTYIIMLKELK